MPGLIVSVLHMLNFTAKWKNLPLLNPLYRWGNKGTQWLRAAPRLTQPVDGRTESEGSRQVGLRVCAWTADCLAKFGTRSPESVR